jgi:hypothetical protein
MTQAPLSCPRYLPSGYSTVDLAGLGQAGETHDEGTVQDLLEHWDGEYVSAGKACD